MKYDVTLVETVIHTFTIDVESDEIGPDETINEVAEEIFLNCPHEELENHGEAIRYREVENVTPQ